mmetsp:Transcript_15842/g.23003  ORF Transcript_15842/g.23003 Transcript_15842/m.23003 type:complete len:180 (-) Transcript_15842:1219-1758(-)
MEDISSSLSKLLPQGFFETADRGPRASSKDVYHAVKEVFSPFGGSSTIPLVHKPEQAKGEYPSIRSVVSYDVPDSSRTTLSSTGSQSVYSDPTRGDDETRVACSPTRTHPRPLAIAVGSRPLEDLDGRPVVITSRRKQLRRAPYHHSPQTVISEPTLPTRSKRDEPLLPELQSHRELCD